MDHLVAASLNHSPDAKRMTTIIDKLAQGETSPQGLTKGAEAVKLRVFDDLYICVLDG
ncbi:hypothetical protein [Streptomyces sp. NPDC058527]|uniref:hypothetical protein n=1 Tax=unclassified Streptomyces TaxID=2593676 RepID=UPI003651B37C